jgi:hypothetical protein
MSNKSDINSGLAQGSLQGLKSGLGLSKMESGIKKGLANGISRRDKVQDPATLPAGKAPLVYWVADLFPEPANPTTVSAGSFPRLAGSATLTAAGNPVRRKGCGTKWFVDFDNATDLITSSTTTGTRELTVFLVTRPCSTVATDITIFSRLNNSFNQLGDLSVFITGSNKIAARLSSAATTAANFVRYETPVLRDYSLINGVKNGLAENEWFLVTIKFNMNRGLDIPQRDIEIYINGTISPATLTNNTWNLEAGQNMPNVSCFFGNAAGGTNPSSSGAHMAAGLVFDYWLSNAEQLRIENFFRYYYGLGF